MVKVYLSGLIPPSGKGLDVSYDWRSHARWRFEQAGYKVLDPLDAKPKSDVAMRRFGSLPKACVDRDRLDIFHSDIVFIYVDESADAEGYLMWGTPGEFVLGTLGHKPKLVVVVTPIKSLREHLWTTALASAVFADLDEAIDFVIEWIPADRY